MSVQPQWGIAAAVLTGYQRQLLGCRGGCQAGSFTNPALALGRDTRYTPRRPLSEDLQRPSLKKPSTCANLIPLSPGTPPPRPPNRRRPWGSPSRRPQAPPLCAPRGPALELRLPALARRCPSVGSGAGPRCRGRGLSGAAPLWGPGERGAAGSRGCPGGGAPGDRAGPA